MYNVLSAGSGGQSNGVLNAGEKMNGEITISLGSGLLQRQAAVSHSLAPFRTAKTLFTTNEVERGRTLARSTTILLEAKARVSNKAKEEWSISPFPPMARRWSNYQARRKGVGEQMKFWRYFGSVRRNQPTASQSANRLGQVPDRKKLPASFFNVQIMLPTCSGNP